MIPIRSSIPIQRALEGMPIGTGLPIIQVPAPTSKQNTDNEQINVALNVRQKSLGP